MIWQIVSADGHIVSNQYTFTWAPSGPFTAAVGAVIRRTAVGSPAAPLPRIPHLGTDAFAKPSANLGLVLGIGGGVVGLGVILTLVICCLPGREPDDVGADFVKR